MCLSDHKLALSTVRDKSLTCTVQTHLSENAILSLSLLISVKLSTFKALFKIAENSLLLLA